MLLTGANILIVQRYKFLVERTKKRQKMSFVVFRREKYAYLCTHDCSCMGGCPVAAVVMQIHRL